MQNIMDYGHIREQRAELEKLVIQHLQHVVMLTVIVIDYYMSFFILHVISTRDIHISSRTKGPRTNMSRGLIWQVLWKMQYHNLFIIYRLRTKVFIRFQYSPLYLIFFKTIPWTQFMSDFDHLYINKNII
jgi:hypothetical protein